MEPTPKGRHCCTLVAQLLVREILGMLSSWIAEEEQALAHRTGLDSQETRVWAP